MLNYRIVKARIGHQCSKCDKKINPTEHYVGSSLKKPRNIIFWDFETIKYCIKCFVKEVTPQIREIQNQRLKKFHIDKFKRSIYTLTTGKTLEPKRR